jgi:hypothetical protein
MLLEEVNGADETMKESNHDEDADTSDAAR